MIFLLILNFRRRIEIVCTENISQLKFKLFRFEIIITAGCFFFLIVLKCINQKNLRYVRRISLCNFLQSATNVHVKSIVDDVCSILLVECNSQYSFHFNFINFEFGKLVRARFVSVGCLSEESLLEM